MSGAVTAAADSAGATGANGAGSRNFACGATKVFYLQAEITDYAMVADARTKKSSR